VVEGYIRNEYLGFITKYLGRFEVVQWQIWDVDEEEGDVNEVLEGVGMKYVMRLHLPSQLDQVLLYYIIRYPTYLRNYCKWTRQNQAKKE
jgi:hypothetical protein